MLICQDARLHRTDSSTGRESRAAASSSASRSRPREARNTSTSRAAPDGVPALMFRLLKDEGLVSRPLRPAGCSAPGTCSSRRPPTSCSTSGHASASCQTTRSCGLFVNQLQLTIANLVGEVHDTHHPIATSLYYADQKPEALRRAADFVAHRLPKFPGLLRAHPLAQPRGRGRLPGRATP